MAVMAFTLSEVLSTSELEPVIALYCQSYETPFNAFYALTRGETGPEEHLQRQIVSHQQDPTSRWLQVVENESGMPVGAAQWNVRTEGHNPYTHGKPPSEPAITWWSDGEPRRFAEHMYEQWGDHRPVKMRDHHLFLNACFVHPDYRRRGVGTMLVEWGIGLADSLGICMFTEATDEGKPLYARHDFLQLNTFYLRSEVQKPSAQWKRLEKRIQTPCHAHLMWRPIGGVQNNKDDDEL